MLKQSNNSSPLNGLFDIYFYLDQKKPWNMQSAPCSRPHFKFNSAFRLHYSLQLIPCYNERHQLVAVHPMPKHRSEMSNSISNGSVRGARNHRHTSSPWRDAETHWSILWVPVIFSIATLCLYLLTLGFPDDVQNKSFQLKFPTSIEDISNMSDFLLHMKDNHLGQLLLVFCAGYIYKQTFAIPGSVFLNLLAGALFGPFYGFLLACPLTAVGATNCYLLSRTFGQSYIERNYPQKVQMFREKVESNSEGLFFFLLFLRLFPMSPNWMMNIVAPIVGIPVHLFFFSVFIGLMPYNFICVQTGSTLSQISSVNDIFTLWTMLKMLMVALVALVPGVIIKKLQVKED